MIKLEKFLVWIGIGLRQVSICVPRGEQEPAPLPTPACPEMTTTVDPICEDLARIKRRLVNLAEQLADGYGPGFHPR